MAKREVIDGKLCVGDWIYDAPAVAPDAEGMTFLAGMKNASDGEFYGLGLDEEGFSFERQGSENDKPDRGTWKKMSLDAFIEKLDEFRYAVMGTSLETWLATYDEAVKKASLAYARLHSGTYYGNPAVSSFAVYDMSKEDAPSRLLPSNGNTPVRLEKYIFKKMKDQTIELEIQVGWHAGTHWDGSGFSRTLPAEWFALRWDDFLDALCKKYPAEKYSYTKPELKNTEGLREYLGLAE
ncbi:MAG: hypothetical protein J5757_01975 [Lachnospiraceae bacterium]|nr:hypothetical protein [Lachnospiraceae bacterium]